MISLFPLCCAFVYFLLHTSQQFWSPASTPAAPPPELLEDKTSVPHPLHKINKENKKMMHRNKLSRSRGAPSALKGNTFVPVFPAIIRKVLVGPGLMGGAGAVVSANNMMNSGDVGSTRPQAQAQPKMAATKSDAANNNIIANTSTHRGASSQEQQLPQQSSRADDVQDFSVFEKFEDFLPDFSSTYEGKLLEHIRFSSKTGSVQERFPLLNPRSHVSVWTTRGPHGTGGQNHGCIMGSGVCKSLDAENARIDIPNGIDERYFPYDPHVRDVISSVLTSACLFPRSRSPGGRGPPAAGAHTNGRGGSLPPSCLALDIGANFGLHTLAMLEFNTQVVSIEPQPDLCASLMTSVQRMGMSRHSRVRCGLFADTFRRKSKTTWDSSFGGVAYRYDGAIESPFSFAKYGLEPPGVPVVPLEDILAAARELRDASKHGISTAPIGDHKKKPAEEKKDAQDEDPLFLNLVKIDTDSIDCDILLQQLLPLLRAKKLDIQNVLFESNGCGTLAQILAAFQAEGYTIFRLDVLEETWWDEHGSLPQFKGTNTSPYARNSKSADPQAYLPERVRNFAQDQYELRFNRHMWKFNDGLSLQDWQDAVGYSAWQFLCTREVWQSRPHKG